MRSDKKRHVNLNVGLLFPFSPFESTCTTEEIDYHIRMLEARNFILETDGFFARGDMETTRQRLLRVFLPPLLSCENVDINNGNNAVALASDVDEPSDEKTAIAQDFVYLECDWPRRAMLLGYLEKVRG